MSLQAAALLAVSLVGCIDPAGIQSSLCDAKRPCPAGFTCLGGACTDRTGEIVTGCTSDEDCARGACLIEARFCVQCIKDAHCPGSSCLEGFMVCGCLEGADCETGRCNLQTANCLSCYSDAQCESGVCELSSGVCEKDQQGEGGSPRSPGDATGGPGPGS